MNKINRFYIIIVITLMIKPLFAVWCGSRSIREYRWPQASVIVRDYLRPSNEQLARNYNAGYVAGATVKYHISWLPTSSLCWGINDMMSTRYTGASVVFSDGLGIMVEPGTFPMGPSIGDSPMSIALRVSAPTGTHYAKYIRLNIAYAYWVCGCELGPDESPHWTPAHATLQFKIPEVIYREEIVPEPEIKTADLVIIHVENPEFDNPVIYSWPTWDLTVANAGYVDSGPFDVSFLVSANMEPWDEDQILWEEEAVETIDNLSRGEVREIHFSASNRTPEHWRVNFMVDSDNQVNEISGYTIDGEDNNLLNIEEIFGWYEDKKTTYFPWPIVNGRTKVTSVLNEPRYKSTVHGIRAPGRFHNGVDINGYVGEDVYAISSSIIEDKFFEAIVKDKGIQTTLFDYFHIDQLYEVYNNRDIDRWIICDGDKIAQLEDYTYGAHLHVNDYSNNSRAFGREGASIYPLRQNGFSPRYTDGYGNDPEWDQNPVRFFKNLKWNWSENELELLAPNNLQEKVDIVLKVKDPPTGSCRASIYGYGWYLKDDQGATVASSQPVLGGARYIGQQRISDEYFHYCYFEKPSDDCDYYSIIVTHQPWDRDGGIITQCAMIDYPLDTTVLENGAYDLVIYIRSQEWPYTHFPMNIPVEINN